MKFFTRLLFSACLFVALRSTAQDIHFSMFYASPLTLNPAMTGAIDDSYRATAIYRNQYRSVSVPFVTYGASFDMRLLQAKLKRDIFGVGALFTSDKSGDGKLTMNNFMASAAYHKSLDKAKHHFIGLGVQLGYTQKSIQWQQLSYPDQYSTSIQNFDPNIPNFENITKPNVGYFDMNMGLLHQSTFSEKLGMMTGISVFHIVPPKESFLGQDVTLAPRVTGNLGFRVKASEHIYITPNFIYQYQNKAQEINFGSGIEYHFATAKSEAVLSVGGWYRVKDAAIISLGAEYYKVRLMFAYDINASGLTNATNGRGAFELAIIFTGILKSHQVVYPVLVPCPMM